MGFRRTAVILCTLPWLAGCGYVHFGRLPIAAPVGDAALATAYANLGTENKILRQEVELARKEQDALRTALDHANGGTSPELVARLNDTTRELASLRASYAKLQAERAAVAGPSPAVSAETLAAAQRDAEQLKAENTRLRSELEQARSASATLADQLKQATATGEQAQAALAQLNAELLAQKDARGRAEQATEAAFAQLRAVTAARAGPANTATPPVPVAAAAPSAKPAPEAQVSLQQAKAPPAGASVELRSGYARPSGPAPRDQTHVVEAGDTLEKLSLRYYGVPDRWRVILDANAALLGNGQPLVPGMELRIPAP